MHFDTEFRELGGDHIGRPELLEGEFGMGVQILAPGRQIGMEIGNAVGNRHKDYPSFRGSG
jgi:hypothetical protein